MKLERVQKVYHCKGMAFLRSERGGELMNDLIPKLLNSRPFSVLMGKPASTLLPPFHTERETETERQRAFMAKMKEVITVILHLL